jgi:hypothetical protein
MLLPKIKEMGSIVYVLILTATRKYSYFGLEAAPQNLGCE